MSFLLSLLIFIPLVGTPLVYLVGRQNRHAGIYLTLGLSVITFLLALYSYWFVYVHPPALGQYALTEKYTWFNFQFIGLDYLVGLDGLSAPLVVL